ncbi:MAG: ATPase [Tannerella sp.]|jgi:V/A-type H+-transporting ATPase subunit I|nr:ATPase [Tannerella sp.]
MIVKMNKYAYLVYHKEYESFLERLRSLGVVHVKQTRPTGDNRSIQNLAAEVKRVKTQLDFLDSLLEKGKSPNIDRSRYNEDFTPSTEALSRDDMESILAEIEDLRDQSAKKQSLLLTLEKEHEMMSVWGDFKYSSIEKLRKVGYAVSFFTCHASRYDPSWEEKYNAFVINTKHSNVYFVTVTDVDEKFSIDAENAKLSPNDYEHICEDMAEQRNNMEDIEDLLFEIAYNNYEAIQTMKNEIENELSWTNVMFQTTPEADDKLMFLEGWIPDDKTRKMENELSDSGYYIQKLEITDDDVIPIKLRNNRFTGLFEPITKLYSLPNYREFDPTPLFAPFFMLFFGLCLGDGGYGLLLILTALLLKNKVSQSMKPIMKLVFYFGVTTLAVGAITGSFFGISIVDAQYFASVRNYFVTSDNLMIISLVIGFFHVLYAKFIAAVKIKIQRGLKYSLSAFAWIFVIVSLACILALPMMNIQLPTAVKYILYGVAAICGAVVLFYNTPGKNIFLNFGSGLWATYNTVSGLVGDVLSYIRLYAIGLTSALLGGVFNSMAVDMTASMNPFVRWLPMLAILLVGHTINIGLGLISSLVHPLRLVFVEYYKNSEFEGGGLDYKPFEKL